MSFLFFLSLSFSLSPSFLFFSHQETETRFLVTTYKEGASRAAPPPGGVPTRARATGRKTGRRRGGRCARRCSARGPRRTSTRTTPRGTRRTTWLPGGRTSCASGFFFENAKRKRTEEKDKVSQMNDSFFLSQSLLERKEREKIKESEKKKQHQNPPSISPAFSLSLSRHSSSLSLSLSLAHGGRLVSLVALLFAPAPGEKQQEQQGPQRRLGAQDPAA